MTKIKAVLLKPLDSDPIGATRSFDKADFDRLLQQGAVKRAPERARATASKKAPPPKNKMTPPPANKSA